MENDNRKEIIIEGITELKKIFKTTYHKNECFKLELLKHLKDNGVSENFCRICKEIMR